MLVEWISQTEEGASVFPDAQVRSPFARQFLKDFTSGSGL
jgi:hypothetical protein